MTETWLEKLAGLALRWSHLGVTADLDAMGDSERWGVYCYLSCLDDDHGAP